MRSVAHRYPLLTKLDSPAALRQLPVGKLAALASELRAFLVHNVVMDAEPLAAAMGGVELAIAVHYVYDTPGDRIVWDGSLPAYPHKVLTGRRDRLHTIRQPGGLQPFPQRAESEYDCFGVGHSGTAISAAAGMAVAAAQRGDSRGVVAVIGERALTAGMAFEALNHAGALPSNLLVVLGDTAPWSPGNTDALASHFARLLSGRTYTQLREHGERMLRPLPTMWELARRSARHLKGMVLPGTLFEELGFHYLGPIDGRNLGALVATLRNLRARPGRHFLHVITRRAKAHAAPDVHSPWPGVPEPGRAAPRSAGPARTDTQAALTYSQVFGRWMCDMAAADPRIIGIAAAVTEEAGLTEFARAFSDRFFDVSTSQQHAVTFAGGLATQGLKPVVALDSTFLQRTYDQLIHDIALQRLAVVFAVDGAGMVGGNGATHQGCFDLSYLRCVPNLTIMTPADEDECRQMLYTASTLGGPAIVRYPRCPGAGVAPRESMHALSFGRAQIRRHGGSGLAVLVFGTLLEAARPVAERLDATLVNMRFVKPLDHELLRNLAADHRALVTIEENARAAGAGSGIGEALASLELALPLLQLGIPDRFIEHGSRESCLASARLDAAGLSDRIERWWMLQTPQQLRTAAAGQ